jgi:hypothetical protein
MQRDRIAAWCMGMLLVIMMRAIGVPRAVNPLATPEVAFNVGQQGFYLLGSIGHTGQQGSAHLLFSIFRHFCNPLDRFIVLVACSNPLTIN